MWVLILILLCSNSYAASFVILRTGFAYSTCNGNIVGKYTQGAGDSVPLSDGCAITDVNSQGELDAIILYKSPQQKQSELYAQALQKSVDTTIQNDPVFKSKQIAINQDIQVEQPVELIK